VICYDELGPLELRPIHGRTWALKHHPDRLRATYQRPHGIRQWLAFYDTRRDQLWGYFQRRKRWQEVLRALRWMRSRYPAHERIYIILDNFAPHLRPEIHDWARGNNVILVWTPTNASWLNHIEPQLTEVHNFVFQNSDYRSHQELQQAMRDFVRYRNRRNRQHKKT
jgi:hypothetical protein